jgi:hypothetical protein
VLIFAGTQMLPGDVAQAILGQSATPEALANLRGTGPERSGLCPLFHWLGGALTGDLGTALSSGQDIAGTRSASGWEHAVPRLLRGGDRRAAGDPARPGRGALPQRAIDKLISGLRAGLDLAAGILHRLCAASISSP